MNKCECQSALTKRKGRDRGHVADAGRKNLIGFSGNRCGVTDEQGIENSLRARDKIVPMAEKRGVTLILELLNSYGHKDYLCDHTAWGVELCKRAGSKNIKLLYDIYHMQIMEGNLIDTIKNNIDYIGHFHTGGNPGRNEINDTQEIYYPAVMRAIVATGYDGYVGHEFIPTSKDRIASLAEGVIICDV